MSTFNGTIDIDIRKSKPDWQGFLATKAPPDAPNVLVILYDDTGCASWSRYGGRVEMPTLDRLASNGLIYSQWHTTAICSPTRSCFLTGRNHHQNGFGTIAESACGFPGYNGHIPKENATLATVLRDAGWSTFWVGKNHNVPVDAFDMGASKKAWPLGLGYDRLAEVGGGFHWGSRWAAYASYRVLDTDYNHDNFLYDLRLSGLLLGFGIKF